MKTYSFGTGEMTVDCTRGEIASLLCDGKELLYGRVPLFTLGLRNGEALRRIDSRSMCYCNGLYVCETMQVRVNVQVTDGALEWGIAVENMGEELLEWIEFPSVKLAPLVQNGGIGTILYPYNEGVLVDDAERRERSWFPSTEPSYPSRGSFPVFPNMLSSQFMCYLFDGYGLYMGAHDPRRAVKYIDFYPDGGGVRMVQRLYCGTNAGEGFETDYAIHWEFFKGNWQSGASIYRAFFEAYLPQGVCKTAEHPSRPTWYDDAPLIVAYPVRGVHDMDEMSPNRLYPYANALPHLDAIANATGARIMALLMHWEGTAPWAPPYVMPPYGGQEAFNAFRDALHARGQLLGVYCSGFGYTLQSNLIEDYRNEISEADAKAAMCTGYDGEVAISNICTAQRKGYDICPASAGGRNILQDAYRPLFESGVDYAQILDQNHGGGQYFCHSKAHGHPSAPGAWMTERMQQMLGEWNAAAPQMLFGCESAAAEPFIGSLGFSDNRYELNYRIGTPVPLYAYLYHEYLRNFMGNQVCSPMGKGTEGLLVRMGYSFAAGDSLTLVMGQDGEILPAWGERDFSVLPDRDTVLAFCRNLSAFYRETGAKFLLAGRMCEGEEVVCTTHDYPLDDGSTITLPDVFSAVWEADGMRARILVNHTRHEVICRFDGAEACVPALNAVRFSYPTKER